MDPDLTIVLLGKSGVGKSASGNTILGRAAFRSEMSFFASVTKEICVVSGLVFGKQISVVDTPGILESEEMITTCCQNLLQSSRNCLFLLVFPVSRFTREDRKTMRTMIRVLGDQGLKKSLLLFTHGESLKNKSLKDLISELDDGSHSDVMRRFSGASHLFNNGDGDQEQVRDLLLKIENLRDHQQLDPTAALQRRIVLLGSSGVGISSSGNTILGSKKFKSAGGFNSVSTECVSESESVDGRLLQVVDTPGFTDEDLNAEQLYEEIMKTLLEASPGPHVFVIVVRIGKISAADQRLLELVPKLFGGDASKFTMVLFTHGDELRGRSMDQLIQSNNCVSDLVSMCDGRYCVFDNTQRGRRLQVRELLDKIDEMVAANGGEHCTSDMFRMAETFIREEKNRAAQSADRNHPGQSGGAREKPAKYSAWDGLIPYVMCFGAIGGVVGGLVGGGADEVGSLLYSYLVNWKALLVLAVVLRGVGIGAITGLIAGLVGEAVGKVNSCLKVSVSVGMAVGWALGWVVLEVPVGWSIGGVVGGALGGLVLAGKYVVNSCHKRTSNRQSNMSSRDSGDEQLSLRTRSRLSEEP